MGLYPGRKILAMDFDFRIPTLHKHFGINAKYGIDQVLTREIPAEKALIETELPSLHIALPRSRKADYNLLLRTQELADMMAYCRERFDLILIDSPAIIPVPDTTMLMPLADAVVLAAMAGRTTAGQLRRAREICNGMDMKVLGMVIGNLREAAPDYVADEYDYYGYAEGGKEPSRKTIAKSRK